MRKEAKWWIEQAKRELESAKKNFDIKEWYIVAFYSQQAAEAAIKALHHEILRELPVVSHNLIDLLTPLEKKVKIPSEVYTKSRYLNPHFLASRYPDVTRGTPYKNYDEEIANFCIKSAEVIINWAIRTLKKA